MDLALNLMKQKFTLKLLPMHPYPSLQAEIDYRKYQRLMLYSKVINLDQVFWQSIKLKVNLLIHLKLRSKSGEKFYLIDCLLYLLMMNNQITKLFNLLCSRIKIMHSNYPWIKYLVFRGMVMLFTNILLLRIVCRLVG